MPSLRFKGFIQDLRKKNLCDLLYQQVNQTCFPELLYSAPAHRRLLKLRVPLAPLSRSRRQQLLTIWSW